MLKRMDALRRRRWAVADRRNVSLERDRDLVTATMSIKCLKKSLELLALGKEDAAVQGILHIIEFLELRAADIAQEHISAESSS